SRQLPQKSFRLYAGKQDDTKYFQYPFFSQKPELMQFKTLLLRATNGTMGSLIKNELCNSLVQYMNIDFLAGETVIAFINGEYWGIYNLTERNDRYYVENNYGLSHCDLDIIGYSWQLNIEEGDSDAYNRLVAFLQNADPESGTFYDEISKKIDIENLIDYYAAQFYFANFDWPKNNLELWRIKSDTCQWRYFFFDPDAAMIHAHYNQIADHKNTLRDYRKYPEFSTLIFETLIKNEAFKREFESVFLHNLKTTFNADRVISMINHYERIYSPLVPENIYRWHNPTDYITWGKNIELLRRFAIQRPVIIAEQLQNNYEHPFMVFPNPSTESFYIDFLYPVNTALLKIYSINGAQLFQQHIDGLQDSLFQPQVNLPPGLYLMHIIIDGIACAQKFIIQ
ncbi:MAG: CotH kinase family protein, partial [Bacteroidales bacterium]|nr:CotH kinase family protein [Bacteroidales bacterium]